MEAAGLRVIQEGAAKPRSLIPHGGEGLLHRRDRHRAVPCSRQIVEPGERHIRRNADAAFLQAGEDGQRQLIVEAEKGVRPLGEGKQALHRLADAEGKRKAAVQAKPIIRTVGKPWRARAYR